MSNEKIIVTGGAGFIGTNMLRYLRSVYPNAHLASFDLAQPIFPIDNVEYIHGDIRSYFHLKEMAKDTTKIFHFAAELGTHETFSSPIVTNDVNINGTINLLELAKEYGFKLFIASKPNVWLNPYSISKEAAEKYAIEYSQEYGVKVAVLKFFSVYGPYQYVYKYNKAVPTFIYSALYNKPIVIYGTGEQEADFLFVEDAVKAADWVLENNIWGKPIEYGLGKGVTINFLAKKIIKLTKSKSKIILTPMRIGETKDSKIFADTKTMNMLLKIQPEVSLESGLIKTIEFYKNNYGNLRY